MRRLSVFALSFLLLTAICYSTDPLPKNTRLEIRLDETIGSDISHDGESFGATLNHAVAIGGKEVLPKGTPITGTIKYAFPTDHYSHPGELEIELTTIGAAEKEYRITTNLLRFQGKERRIDPTTGKQDDRGTRAEDTARAGIGVIGAKSPPAQTIPGTDVAVGPSNPPSGMQVILPVKTKLVFTLTSSQ